MLENVMEKFYVWKNISWRFFLLLIVLDIQCAFLLFVK